ncbi:MAG: FMN-binding protein [Hornefia sp.]|nr:FMN-binding protein [Hornefia sp.]
MKIELEYDSASGKIISVKDRGTETYINKTSEDFKKRALEAWKKFNDGDGFGKFAGKTFEQIDSVEAVSGATQTSATVKKAVKDAEVNNRVKQEILAKIDAFDENDYDGQEKENFKKFIAEQRKG